MSLCWKCGWMFGNQPFKITLWGQLRIQNGPLHKIETFWGALDFFGPINGTSRHWIIICFQLRYIWFNELRMVLLCPSEPEHDDVAVPPGVLHEDHQRAHAGGNQSGQGLPTGSIFHRKVGSHLPTSESLYPIWLFGIFLWYTVPTLDRYLPICVKTYLYR